eukprot:760066-Hanusia_phi.AAC.1
MYEDSDGGDDDNDCDCDGSVYDGDGDGDDDDDDDDDDIDVVDHVDGEEERIYPDVLHCNRKIKNQPEMDQPPEESQGLSSESDITRSIVDPFGRQRPRRALIQRASSQSKAILEKMQQQEVSCLRSSPVLSPPLLVFSSPLLPPMKRPSPPLQPFSRRLQALSPVLSPPLSFSSVLTCPQALLQQALPEIAQTVDKTSDRRYRGAGAGAGAGAEARPGTRGARGGARGGDGGGAWRTRGGASGGGWRDEEPDAGGREQDRGWAERGERGGFRGEEQASKKKWQVRRVRNPEARSDESGGNINGEGQQSSMRREEAPAARERTGMEEEEE